MSKFDMLFWRFVPPEHGQITGAGPYLSEVAARVEAPVGAVIVGIPVMFLAEVMPKERYEQPGN